MKSPNLLAILALALLALTGCSNSNEAENKPMESVAPVESETATTSADTNDRGNIEKQIGEEGSVTGEHNENIYSFKVTGIEPNFKCTDEYAQEPENGKFVKLDVQVSTADAKTMKDQYYGNSVNMQAGAWKYIAANGTTYNGQLGSGSSFMCLPESETIPAQIGPNEKVTGSVILDVPATDGTIVYSDPMTDGGWEYDLSK
ncbi:hypothetical protein [Rothia amarae]|uniref:hypothetical protein n=1 Tax=Rothia amarae TaxID=169480 RepID=UPI0031CE11F5